MGRRRLGILAAIGPGILVAATGVGAGDLATAAFTGSQLGTAVLWAVVVGAFLKFVINEGLARWQLATGTTLIEGAVRLFGRPLAWVFLPYLFFWSFFVASALMSACGATFHALVPVLDDPVRAKVIFGVGHSLLGVALVVAGGFRLFERVMSVCIAVMFATVLATAGLLWPGTRDVLAGFVPAPAELRGEGLTWTVALMGGVGGTLTVLCYGYWMRESGRSGKEDLALTRLDLGVAYGMTALFGIAMVIIGSTVDVSGRGAGLVVELAKRLEGPLGAAGAWAFLIGAWGAVFSSLLGVWQAVPYVFADFCSRLREGDSDRDGAPSATVDTRSLPYRLYLLLIATVPMLGLVVGFREMQKLYAVVGACFIPLLAVALLILNGSRRRVGAGMRNRAPTVAVLVAALVFFLWSLWMKIAEQL